jgi:hypothetical protein
LDRRIDNAHRDSAGFYRHTDPGETSFLQPRGTPQEQAALQRRIAGEAPLAYIYPEALPRDIDYLNRERRTWQYPLVEGGRDARSFPEIYAQALETALGTLGPLAAAYSETGSPPDGETIARRIGNGGLSIQDREGKPCPATRSEPLPLERVLEQQRQARLELAQSGLTRRYCDKLLRHPLHVGILIEKAVNNGFEIVAHGELFT